MRDGSVNGRVGRFVVCRCRYENNKFRLKNNNYTIMTSTMREIEIKRELYTLIYTLIPKLLLLILMQLPNEKEFIFANKKYKRDLKQLDSNYF